MKQLLTFLYLLALLTFMGCIKKYNPSLKESDDNVLVVEGNLDPGDDSTFIRLTRTVNVNDTTKIRVEDKAQLVIEGKDNTKRTLIGKGKGYYVFPGLHLTIGSEYRLRIKTLAGDEYLSDYVQARRSPPIDSLTWKLDIVGLHFYVHTHDPSKSTVYYRWDCVEAWEIRMGIIPEVIYNNGIVRPIIWPQDNMSECFIYDSTESLILANSTKLSDDVISYKEIKTIPYHNGKIKWMYGILTKQYAIDEAANRFFTYMKQTTETTGGIFAQQPFALKGNIRSTKDTSRFAVGYVTASTISRASRTISGPELIYWRPRSVPGMIDDSDCKDSMIIVNNNITDLRYYFDQRGFLPYKEFAPFGTLLGYYASKAACIDCRISGAIATKPYFF